VRWVARKGVLATQRARTRSKGGTGRNNCKDICGGAGAGGSGWERRRQQWGDIKGSGAESQREWVVGLCVRRTRKAKTGLKDTGKGKSLGPQIRSGSRIYPLGGNRGDGDKRNHAYKEVQVRLGREKTKKREKKSSCSPLVKLSIAQNQHPA